MTTTLDVLNHMLNVIGESPVSTETSDHPSVLAAMVELERVRKETQSRGYWFNTEYNLKLLPNDLGQILIPSDTLFIDPVDPYAHLVRRGGKLYDPINHTFVINRPIYVNAVLLLDMADLPETAAIYVMHQAAYDFYVNDDGDEAKSTRLERRVGQAWAKLQSEELKVTKVNAKNRPAAAQLRYRMRQQGVNYDPRWPGGRV